jgi:hypothetical protein
MVSEYDTAPLRFHRLSFLEERGEVVVGRADRGPFAVLPPDGAALVRELAAGRSPAGAAAWYAQTYRESVDIEGFIDTLRELGLVREDGHEPVEAAAIAPVRWQRLGRALFSRQAGLAFALLLVAAVAACAADPRMLPRSSNVFFSDYIMVVSVTIVVGQLALAVVHEAFHALAGRRLGVRSRIRVSRRFYFIVFETDLDGLAVVPRRQRALPLLAGLLSDGLAVAALTVTAYVTRGHDAQVSSTVSAVCLALAFTTLLRMAWQFLYFFLRTDIYYLITALTGSVDLDGTARDVLANWVNRRLGRRDRLRDLDARHPRDRRAARWFLPIMIAGYAAMLGMLVLMLPASWQFLSSAAERVFAGAPSSAQFWDSALLLVFAACQPAMLLALIVRGRRSSSRSL